VGLWALAGWAGNLPLAFWGGGVAEEPVGKVLRVEVGCDGYYSFWSTDAKTNLHWWVSNSISFPSGYVLTNVVLTPSFPPGSWILKAVTGNCSVSIVGSTLVVTGEYGESVWFRYRAKAPPNAGVSNNLGGQVVCGFGSPGMTVTSVFGEMPIFRYHQADYRAPHRTIDLTEIVRLLSFNFYKMSSLGDDGYAVSTTRYTGSTNNGLHSADYNNAGTNSWAIDSEEEGRVNSYWSANGYHVDLTTPDGYAAGIEGPGPGWTVSTNVVELE
jgi:hypothetical protein